MATISDLISRLRKDLHDEDEARWSDAVLQRHIERAIREYGIADPIQRRTTITTEAGVRDISISGLENLLRLDAVEWPTGLVPPAYAPFTIWESTLSLLTDMLPNGEDATIHWMALHQLDGSTLPVAAEEIILRGAAGHAALELASHTTNKVNVGGERTSSEYRAWAETTLAAYRADLDRLRRTLRSRVVR